MVEFRVEANGTAVERLEHIAVGALDRFGDGFNRGFVHKWRGTGGTKFIGGSGFHDGPDACCQPFMDIGVSAERMVVL